MGRRGRSGSGPVSGELRRHIESCKDDFLSVEELVDHLRSTYHKYSRSKLQDLTRQVQTVLQVRNPNPNPTEEVTPPRKKPKRDSSEQRLRLLEKKHIMNSQRKKQEADGESSTLATTSESDDSYSSSSSDAIYGEKLEEKPDLMKSMLRHTYNKQVNNTPKSKKIEYEVVHDNNDEKRKKINMSKGGQRRNEATSDLGGGGGEAREGEKIGENDGNGDDGPRFKDLGGMDRVLEELKMEVIVPLYHPQLTKHLGVRPMSGILFHGPPGCGKTKLAHAIANETGVPFYKLSATELVSGISGASEENIRELFSKAYRTAPSIVFIDEIDAIASKRENLQREMERRIVTQLMTCMDESHKIVKPDDDAKGTTVQTGKRNSEAKSEGSRDGPGYVLVIGATNRPDAIDPALRRPGRFDREIALGIPDENARLQILSVLTRNLRVEGAFDLMKIARSTPGFVGADLAALTNKAGNLAMKRILDLRKVELSRELVDGEDAEEWWRKPWSPEEMEKLSINMADFEEAAKLIQPSSRREGFSAIPNVMWKDVGGLDSLRQEFELSIVKRIKEPEAYLEFGVDNETGFLLYGPPGCGKTLIAKAVANEAGANFIHIKGPEILNKYVGESELAIRTLFTRARTCSPCILFFDEMDALTTKRGKEGGWVVERLLNQLLIELDGADQRKGVYVIGATNRPEVMDQAILRPGRLGKLLYVPLPSPDERGLILKALARNKPIDTNVDLMTIGRDDACKNLSGADLSALMNEAAMVALEDKLRALDTSCGDTPSTIKESHFKRALEKISPSVSDKQIGYYQRLSKTLRAA
ncbi:PREDICTED: cell division control protein 48 homolog C [Nicotiana attenuata]|uniref:Cell division control protein 48 -like c n=1 Tax=Nicotiana attenuata TaxID=49451 RepID=A0A1J6KKI8_NICAT|nr:PREDICTED: cell division control protein 48 homolog C [Nicotiana attenuata]OIT22303.1 cell division control protein 48 -like c [Nicotiana attenuata]